MICTYFEIRNGFVPAIRGSSSSLPRSWWCQLRGFDGISLTAKLLRFYEKIGEIVSLVKQKCPCGGRFRGAGQIRVRHESTPKSILKSCRTVTRRVGSFRRDSGSGKRTVPKNVDGLFSEIRSGQPRLQ